MLSGVVASAFASTSATSASVGSRSTDERGRPGAGLIGVVVDERTATIYHTRVLTAEGIVHELLHVAFPDWSEARVVLETQRCWRESREHTPCARDEREAATRVA